MYNIYVISGKNIIQSKKTEAAVKVSAVITQNSKQYTVILGKTTQSKTAEWDKGKSSPFILPFLKPDILQFNVESRNQKTPLTASIEYKDFVFFQTIQANLFSASNASDSFLTILIEPIFSVAPYATPLPTNIMNYLYLTYDPPLEDPNQIKISLHFLDSKEILNEFPTEKPPRPRGINLFNPPNSMKLTPTGWTPIFIFNSKEFSFTEFYTTITSYGYKGKIFVRYAFSDPEPILKSPDSNPIRLESPPSKLSLFKTDVLDFSKYDFKSESVETLNGSTFIKVNDQPQLLNRVQMDYNFSYSLKALLTYHYQDSESFIISVPGSGLCGSSSRSFQISAYVTNIHRPDTEDYVNSQHQVHFDGALEYQQANENRCNQILVNLKGIPTTSNAVIIYIDVWPKTPLRKTKGCYLKVKTQTNYELLFIDLDKFPVQKNETGLEEGIIGMILYNDPDKGWVVLPPACPIHGGFQSVVFDVESQILAYLMEPNILSVAKNVAKLSEAQ